MNQNIVWEIDVPLLTNRIILGGVLRAFGLAALIMGSLLTLLVAVQGDPDAIAPMWLITSVVCGALVIVALAVMALFFRNRLRFRYTVSDDGVLAEQIDTTARTANRLAVLAGALSGSPSTSGAGLIAVSQETQAVGFSGAFTAEYLPRQRVIAFRNAWRRVLYVYCTAENYDAVAARVHAAMSAHKTAERVPGRSPLPRYVGLTLLVVAASLPAFLTVEGFDVPLIVPMLMLCFGVAMIWLINLFGLVVIGTVLAEAVFVILDATGRVESFFYRGTTYARWTVYSGDDWALVTMTALGMAVLCWLSLRALSGRLASALASDFADMAGDETES